jgi:hypothetical protein
MWCPEASGSLFYMVWQGLALSGMKRSHSSHHQSQWIVSYHFVIVCALEEAILALARHANLIFGSP